MASTDLAEKMPDTEKRKEPVLEPALAMIPEPRDARTETTRPETTRPPEARILAPAPAQPSSASDQFTPLARIEDKTARIEEKFARAEERMVRVETALEKATLRLEGATQDMNLQGLKDDVAALRHDIRRKPGLVSIFVVALVSALLGAATVAIAMRLGLDRLITTLTSGGATPL